MSGGWKKILQQQVDNKGAATVAREIGVSAAALSLVLADKYPAKTDNIERKVMSMYGSPSGKVECPFLGEIGPDACAINWSRAKKIGMKCGNPATLKLYKTCLKCALRN